MGCAFVPIMTFSELKLRCAGKPLAYRRVMWSIICQHYHTHRFICTQKQYAEMIGCSTSLFAYHYRLYRANKGIKPYDFK